MSSDDPSTARRRPRTHWVAQLASLAALLTFAGCAGEVNPSTAMGVPTNGVAPGTPAAAGGAGLAPGAQTPEPMAAGGAGMVAAGGTAPVVPGEPAPFVPGQTSGVQPPEAYVAKVKNLINGGVPSQEEVAQVKANPDSLNLLVDEWMKSPSFKQKMMIFLTESLQQGGFDRDALQANQLRDYAPQSGWISEIIEMFPRTAWGIVENDRPFTEIATTRRFALTTNLLVVLSYLDLAPKEARKKDITIFHDTLPQGRTAPANWSESVDQLLFQVPDALTPGRVGQGCTLPFTINHDAFLRLLMGEHGPNCSPQRLSTSLLLDSDRTDWREVELSDAAAGESTIAYYDLPKLRAANTLKLKQQRVGFFTTPAYLARHETNEDNSFRVTANQALIVALGHAFDNEDVTIPFRTAAVEEEHAAPNSVCYGCHVSLDPMRNYFANEFGPDYRAKDMPVTAETSFGFGGIKVDGGDLVAFGAALATHPRFAPAWAQKLCQWATSQPCQDSDPEFQRVVDVFVGSNYSFKTLVREMLSSPLVTGAEETLTQQELNGTIVSISRRTHLCTALSTRLEIPGLCDTPRIRRVLDIVPEDEYGRGAVTAALASSPSLMLSGGLDSVCNSIAVTVVSSNNTLERYNHAAPAAAIDLMVTQVMGIPAGDTRRAGLLTTLNGHYQQATTAKASPKNALISTFRLACQSPTAIGLGL